MIQRNLYTAIETALAAIATTPELLDDLFTDFLEFDADEVASIKKFFLETPPNLITAYPRSDADFPLIAIALADEGGGADFLNSDSGTDDDEDSTDFGSDGVGNFWDHAFQIFCYTQNPDATVWVYEVVKAAINANAHDYFRDQGMYDINIRGAELAPDEKYVPDIVFGRALTFRCKDEYLLIARGSKVGKAFKVSGIHVDNSGSPSDVGGVKTNVTVKAQ